MLITNINYTTDLDTIENLILAIMWQRRYKGAIIQKLLARTLGVSDKTISRAFKQLTLKGYIERAFVNWDKIKGYPYYKYIFTEKARKLYKVDFREANKEGIEIEKKDELSILFNKVYQKAKKGELNI